MRITTLINPKREFIQPDRAATYAYYGTFIILGMVTASMGPSLSFLAENTSTALGNIGLVFSARAGGYLSGSLLSGGAYDRFSGHRIMAVMLFLLGVLFFALPAVIHLWLLILIVFFLGFAEGAVDVGGNTLLVWIHQKKVAPFMNALHAFFGVGSFLAPLILAQTINWGSNFVAGYRLIAILIFPMAFWIWRLPSPDAPTPEKPSQTVQAPQKSATSKWIVLIALFLFLYVGLEVGFSGWIFTYARAIGLATETSAAILTAFFWGGFTVARIFSIPLATRAQPKTLLQMGLASGLLSIAVIIIFPASALALWGGTLSLGISIAAIFPSTISFAENIISLTGKLTRWFFVGAGLGAMGLPWLLGKFFENYGALAVVRALFVDTLLALIVFLGIIMLGRAREKR